MTITKASELFSKDGRFFPREPTHEELGQAVSAPFPADEAGEEGYATLVEETEGPLEEWWIAVRRG